jgi:hypothetical protein
VRKKQEVQDEVIEANFFVKKPKLKKEFGLIDEYSGPRDTSVRTFGNQHSGK